MIGTALFTRDSGSRLRPGSTGQWLAWHARRQPDAVALVQRGSATTYRSLAGQVVGVMDDLLAAGIEPGRVVGVAVTDRHLHLLIVLAAEALAITTMSLSASEIGGDVRLDRLCDWIIGSAGLAVAGRLLVAPPDWLERAAGRVVKERRLDELEAEAMPEAVVRLIKSSGTMGVPKVMGMTHLVQQRVIGKCLFECPDWVTSHPDYLCLYGFGVRASHSRALATLRAGGTIHFTAADAMPALLRDGIGNYALFLAGDLERFVRALPFGAGPFRLWLDVIGASVPARLRRETRAKLTEHLMVTYSSNETNRVSVVDDDDVGTLLPGVAVSIVDASGRAVPPGESGTIRIRTDTMVTSYVDAAAMTERAFVDGWFISSDIGFQPSPDTLVVLGRTDGILNVGGVKVSPGPIEQRLRGIEGIRDALVMSVDDTLETRVMLVAVEVAAGVDPALLGPAIGAVVRAHVATFVWLPLAALPRTETGKVRREAVRALYRARTQLL